MGPLLSDISGDANQMKDNRKTYSTSEHMASEVRFGTDSDIAFNFFTDSQLKNRTDTRLAFLIFGSYLFVVYQKSKQRVRTGEAVREY